MEPGPKTQEQLRLLGQNWNTGEHVLVSGGTGSGKTTLASKIVKLRLDRGAYVVNFVAKPNADETILKEYAGWSRWTEWKRKPNQGERRVLLWPDTSKCRGRKEIISHQRSVFLKAIERLMVSGRWTVQFDEGLYMVDPTFANMSADIAMAHALGRSADLTLITLCQRPANLPLIIYGSADHAFASQTRVEADMLRLANLGGGQDKRELGKMLSNLRKRDFLWIPARAEGIDPQVVNLKD